MPFVQCAYCHTVLDARVQAEHVCPRTNEQRRRPSEPPIFDPANDPILFRGQKPVTAIRDARVAFPDDPTVTVAQVAAERGRP